METLHRQAAVRLSGGLFRRRAGGELLVIDIDPNTGEETGRVLKKAGRYAHKPAGDTHIEVGGPEGALVLFSIYAPHGNLVEALARDGSVADTTTLAPILESQRRKRS